MKYLKEIKKFIGERVQYDTYGGGYIWGKTKKGDEMLAQVVDVDEPALEEDKGEVPVVSIRGWGAIQHMFKTEREQIDFQDELGIFIQDAINEKLSRLNGEQ